jgi:hypothetical protein
MSTDWTQLKTFDDWSGKLRELLDRGSRAADPAARGDVADELLEYADEAPLGLGGIGDLKRRAREAIKDLALADLQAGMASLRSRSQDLASQLQLIKEVTAEANKDAKSIKLENLDRLAKSATDAITSLMEAKASISNGADLPALASKIDKGITSLETLRQSLEKLTS